ncbi:MAG: hypothetical protein U0T07_09685 [Chitinophagales bacterium]
MINIEPRKGIEYAEIASLKLEEAINYLESIPKYKVSDFKLIDLLNAENFQKPIIDTYFRDLSNNGIYIFYDENKNVRYIGQSKKGFYERILTQLDTTVYQYFGWNALLRKIGGIRTGKHHHELTEDDHCVDFETVKNYYLLLIAVPDKFEDWKLPQLEKYLMKAYREVNYHKGNCLLLNTRIGWLNDSDWEIPINDLLNK